MQFLNHIGQNTVESIFSTDRKTIKYEKSSFSFSLITGAFVRRKIPDHEGLWIAFKISEQDIENDFTFFFQIAF